MPDLLIEIVDENDQPIGVVSMAEAQKKGLSHRIVRIMVEDNAGNVLLQKRSATMILYPGCWDNSAAGHVDQGETYATAAIRELSEEIGLTGVPLVEIGYYSSNTKYKTRLLNRFNKVYKVVIEPNVQFTLQTDEVAGVKWFSVAETKEMILRYPDKVSDGLIDVFERYY
jgi:isopentenyl-diphosphate delta-isomerase type 1